MLRRVDYYDHARGEDQGEHVMSGEPHTAQADVNKRRLRRADRHL